jgi:hypothetical protein
MTPPDRIPTIVNHDGHYYAAGHTRANNGILPLASGAMLIRCSQPSGSVQLVLDVTGYLQ